MKTTFWIGLLLLLTLGFMGCESRSRQKWSVPLETPSPISIRAVHDEAVTAFCGKACDIQLAAAPMVFYGPTGSGVQFSGSAWYDLEGNPILTHEAAEIITDFGNNKGATFKTGGDL